MKCNKTLWSVTKPLWSVTTCDANYIFVPYLEHCPKQCLNNFYIFTKKHWKFQKTGFLAIILGKRRPNFGPKVQKKCFFTQKMVKKALRGQNLARIFDFGSRLSSFRAENTSKSLPFRQKNRSLTKISFVQKIQKKTTIMAL